MQQLAYHPLRDQDRDGLANKGVYAITTYIPKHVSQFQNVCKVVDLGSGSGCFVATARERGLDACGIDLRNVFKYSGNFAAANILDGLPFADATFDLAYECLFLDDLASLQGLGSEGVNRAAIEISRVVRPGGFFLTHGGASAKFEARQSGFEEIWRLPTDAMVLYQKT